MGRIYVDKYTGRLERTDVYQVKLTLKDGSVIEHLEPRRLFPFSNTTMFITLLDENEREVAFIRDYTELDPASVKVLEEWLVEVDSGYRPRANHVPHPQPSQRHQARARHGTCPRARQQRQPLRDPRLHRTGRTQQAPAVLLSVKPRAHPKCNRVFGMRSSSFFRSADFEPFHH